MPSRSSRCAHALAIAPAGERERQVDVVRDREERQQGAALHDIAEMARAQARQSLQVALAPQLPHVRGRAVGLETERLGAVGSERQADDVEQGALARAALADHREPLARPERQMLDRQLEHAIIGGTPLAHLLQHETHE